MKCSPLFLTKNIRLTADLSIKNRASTQFLLGTFRSADIRRMHRGRRKLVVCRSPS